MFSEAEQRRLAEMEAFLRADDPAFVQQFDVHRHISRTSKIVAFLGLLLAAVITCVAMIAGSPVLAVLGLCGVGVALGLSLPHRPR